MNSHDNQALADLRDGSIWTNHVLNMTVPYIWPMPDRVRIQLSYLESNFGYEALNDGLYSPAECEHGTKVLRKWSGVFK